MQKTGPGYAMIQLTRKVFIYGFIVLSLTLLASGQPVFPAGIDGRAVASVFYLGIVASSLAFILWNRAIKAIGPVKTNQYIYLIPVMTTAVSAIVLNERITLMTLLGTVLILSGLYLSEKSQAGGQDSTKEKGPDARWI
jgi:drug/metabolite transporter (DMT)-like permease